MLSSNPLVKRLLVLYGDPKTDDPDGFAAEYVNALRGLDKSVLQTAGDLIVRERKYRSWPTVADVLEVIDRAKAMHAARARVGVALTTIENFDAWWSDLITDVRTASDESAIDRAIAVMEPYWRAKWIRHGGPHCRMAEIQRHADIRRAVLRGQPIPREHEEIATAETRARVQAIVDQMHRTMADRMPKERKPVRADMSREAFEHMQNISPNAGLHMTRDGLSKRSKAMSGDREDAA